MSGHSCTISTGRFLDDRDPPDFSHFYRLRRPPYLTERFGQRCRLLITSRRNVLIQFEDGTRVVSHRWAVRKAR